jgi:hypothetical protein
MKNNKRYLIILLFIIFKGGILFCQEKNSSKNDINEQLFSSNHLAFSAKPLIFNKGKIKGERLPFNPASNSRFGFEAGFDYLLNKNKKTSLNMGFHIGFAPRNFTYTIPENYLPVPFEQSKVVNGAISNIFPLVYANFPFVLEKRVFKKNKFIFYSAGINIKYSLMFGENEDSRSLDSRGTLIWKLEENWNNRSNFFFQGNLSVGYGYVLNNHNIFKLGLITNIAFNNVNNSNYTFSPPLGNIQQGIYTTKAGFIGLSINYVLTNSDNKKKSDFLRKK